MSCHETGRCALHPQEAVRNPMTRNPQEWEMWCAKVREVSVTTALIQQNERLKHVCICVSILFPKHEWQFKTVSSESHNVSYVLYGGAMQNLSFHLHNSFRPSCSKVIQHTLSAVAYCHSKGRVMAESWTARWIIDPSRMAIYQIHIARWMTRVTQKTKL